MCSNRNHRKHLKENNIMFKKLIFLFSIAAVITLAAGTAIAGVAYPNPPGGWTYIYQGDTAASAVNAALDGTWDHYDALGNGSDAWDGSGIGAGVFGGAGVLTDGTTTFLRIQDCGDPRDAPPNPADPTNRKLTFTHNITNEVANGATILNDGVTLSFRARIPTTPPLDSYCPDGGGGPLAWTTRGYNIHDDGYGAFGIKQGTGGNGVICFSLCMDTDAGTISGNGLTMNKRNGIAVSADVDSEDSAGTENTLIGFDPTEWHEFWIVIQGDTSGGGTHKVTIYMDGSVSPTFFHVTAGTKDEYDWSGYLVMSLGKTSLAGAQDVDFFAYKAGRVHPPGAMTKAYTPNPTNGATKVTSTILQWQPGTTAAAHDVYLGTDLTAVTNATTSSPEYKEQKGQADTQYVASGLAAATTYYWRIDEIEEESIIYKGDVWSFTIAGLKAYDPIPADGSKYLDTTVELSWTRGFNVKALSGHDVYFGTNATAVANATTSSAEFKANRSTTAYTPPTLAIDTNYYWRIDERNNDNTVTKGDVWNFKTKPSILITDPNLLTWWKLDEGEDIYLIDSSGHDHYGAFGSPAPIWTTGLIGNGLQFAGNGDYVEDADGGTYLNGLSALTVCVWIKSDLTGTDRGFVSFEDPSGSDDRNIRYDASGSTAGGTNVIKFGVTSTGGGQENESSSNVQVTDWQHIAMTWSSGEVVRLYINGILDTLSSEAAATTGTTTGCTKLVIGKGCKDSVSASWDGMVDDVRIYNKALTADQIKQAMRGDPKLAWNPKPANGSTPQLGNVTPLSWSAGSMTSMHDVYFGSDRTAVSNATTSTAGIYRGRQVAASYTPPESLDTLQSYYWRIDEYNTDTTITRGVVWSFTVANYLIVDDFEDYNDYTPKRIFENWIDGLGYADPPPGNLGNGTGSMVGYADAPFAEQSIIHGGKQSMPLEYNNAKTPYYSETDRTFATARDWSVYGVKALTLWFRGYPAAVGSFIQSPPGTYTITALGADIWDLVTPRKTWFHDEFHYGYQQITGNLVTIIAKVESVTNTDPWAKAGVMVRDSLDPNSAHAMVCVTPGQGVAFQYRATAGGASTTALQQTGLAAPYWVKLEFDAAFGNFRAYHSSDGSNWTQLGTQQAIAMTAPYYVGLSLTSHNVNTMCTAKFSNVTITGASGTWANQDIGITSNVAAPLYVVLTDSNAKTGKVNNEADPNAVLQGTWQEWNIDMKNFANAGVSLNAIKKITIGVGNKAAPQPGPTGMLFIDDIRLYLPRYVPGKGTILTADLNSNGAVGNEDLSILANDWLEGDYTVYATAPKDANLVVRYQFENNTQDSSGHNFHGTPQGTPTYEAGAAGQAIKLEPNDYVDCGNPTALDFGTGNWSVCAWIKTTMTGTGDADKGTIFAKGGDQGGGIRYTLAVNEIQSSKVTLTTDDNISKIQVTSTITVNDNAWHHVVGVRDGSTLRLYVDGLPDGTTTLPAGYDLAGTSQRNGYVGVITNHSDGTLQKFLNGSVDDVRVYSYALSNSEILSVMGLSQLYVPISSPAEIYNAEPINSRRVNFNDLSTMSGQWRKRQIWPEW